MRQAQAASGEILNSWKEIASYFDRGIRTVQRWEQQLGMPVHRIGTAKRGPVYARAAELKFWMMTSDAAREIKLPPKMEPLRPGTKPIEDSRRLLKSVHALVHMIAESSVRQRKQAEELEKRILQMRSQMNGAKGR